MSPAILIPACASSSLAFLMIYSAYKWNKQSDNIQLWCIPFPIWKQSVVPCPILNVASWPAYRFLRRQGQVVWYSHLLKSFPQFVVIHTIKVFGVVKKAEIDVFLELSCFFDDPMDVAIWSLVPLPFPNPVWTSGVLHSHTVEAWFGEFWALLY